MSLTPEQIDDIISSVPAPAQGVVDMNHLRAIVTATINLMDEKAWTLIGKGDPPHHQTVLTWVEDGGWVSTCSVDSDCWDSKKGWASQQNGLMTMRSILAWRLPPAGPNFTV